MMGGKGERRQLTCKNLHSKWTLPECLPGFPASPVSPFFPGGPSTLSPCKILIDFKLSKINVSITLSPFVPVNPRSPRSPTENEVQVS